MVSQRVGEAEGTMPGAVDRFGWRLVRACPCSDECPGARVG